MSNDSNAALFERAHLVKTMYEGTILETAINNLLVNNNLEELEYLVCQAEADLAREEFYASDTI